MLIVQNFVLLRDFIVNNCKIYISFKEIQNDLSSFCLRMTSSLIGHNVRYTMRNVLLVLDAFHLSLCGYTGTGQFSTMMRSEKFHRDGGPNRENRKSEKRERLARKRSRKTKREGGTDLT